MVKKSFEEKKVMVEANRKRNYTESLRLEGFSTKEPLHGKTKEEIIAFYTQKVAKP